MIKYSLGEHRHTGEREVNDFYATDPVNVREIMEILNIKGLRILEPCAGLGHMSEELAKDNIVITNEMVERDYETDYTYDFLEMPIVDKFDMVVMNPPFKFTSEFVEKSFEFSDKIVMFQKLSFLESKKRYDGIFSKNNLKEVYIYSHRVVCAKNGDFETYTGGTTIAFAWFVFDKKYNGKPQLSWITK